MFPIRDHNPAGRTPYVTYALIVANAAVFLSYVPLFADPRALNEFFQFWAIVPLRVVGGDGAATLVTSMFLHGGWLHLIGNMLFLHIFGDNVEDQLGHVGFGLFYLAGGLGAGILQIAADPYSPVPMVGASGAIAAVMGGYLLMFPRARVDLFLFLIVIIRILPVPAWLMLGLWFGMQVVSGIGAEQGTGGVAYWAHAGGFLVGVAMMLPVWLAKGGPRFWSRAKGHPAWPPARYRMVPTHVPDVPRAQDPAQAPTRVPKAGRRR